MDQVFQVCGIAHVLSLAARECISTVHTRIEKFQSFLATIQSSVKERYLFEAVHVQVHVLCDSLLLDCETRWSFTSTVIEQSFKAWCILNTMISKCPDIAWRWITETEWKSAAKVHELLETAALATKLKSETKYLTLSFTAELFEKLNKLCSEVIKKSDSILVEVATPMRYSQPRLSRVHP